MHSVTTKTTKDTTMMITNNNRGCGLLPQSNLNRGDGFQPSHARQVCKKCDGWKPSPRKMPPRTVLHLIAITLLLVWPCAADAQLPAQAPTAPIALVDAAIFPISGEPIEKGTILIDQGKIKAIGQDIVIPEGTTTISLEGKSIYPGFIESHSQIGLTEIAAVKATNDYREPGAINPNVKALVSINMENAVLPVTRSGGVLVALSAPEGGIIAGRSAVVQLEGWTYEDMAIKPCLLYTSPSPRDQRGYRMPSSA